MGQLDPFFIQCAILVKRVAIRDDDDLKYILCLSFCK